MGLKGTLKETLIEAKPTVFFAVPRVWEKFAEGLQAKGKEITGLKAKISAFMKGKCAGVHAASQVGATVGHPFMGGFAMKFMKKKAHAAIGLDQARVCLTGAAPIMKHTLDYFGTIGIHILEVYGMSENTGPQNVCKSDYFKAVLAACRFRASRSSSTTSRGATRMAKVRFASVAVTS